jgi:hypothetical protein
MKLFSGNSLNILVCLCFNAASMFAQAGGSLAGSVSDEGVRPIAGAVVIANRAGLPAATGSAISAADGTFQVNGLPAGSYAVCVQVPGGGFVDACQWSSPLTVAVNAGQPVVGLQFPLKRGAILQVRLNDPGQLLLAASPVTKTVPHVLLGVQTPRGLLLPVTLVARDATGTTHAVTIPFDTAVNFTIFGDHVSLTDQTGAPAGLGGSTVAVTLPSVSNAPVTPPSGANSIPLTFNVTGPK